MLNVAFPGACLTAGMVYTLAQRAWHKVQQGGKSTAARTVWQPSDWLLRFLHAIIDGCQPFHQGRVAVVVGRVHGIVVDCPLQTRDKPASHITGAPLQPPDPIICQCQPASQLTCNTSQPAVHQQALPHAKQKRAA